MGLNPRSTILPQQCPLSKTENCLKANNLKKETFFFRKNTINGMKLQNDNKKELLFLNTELLQPEVKNWLYITCHPLQDSQSWHEKALLLFFPLLFLQHWRAQWEQWVSLSSGPSLTNWCVCTRQMGSWGWTESSQRIQNGQEQLTGHPGALPFGGALG